MSEAGKQKFLVLYLVPAAVVADWVATPAEKRAPAEQKMQAEWREWMSAHGAMILSTEAAGKTKRVTTAGVADHKNDVMLYAFVEAESQEAAAKAFENHRTCKSRNRRSR
jgi:hypothetical protein